MGIQTLGSILRFFFQFKKFQMSGLLMIKASISTHYSVLLILQKQCKTPLERRRFIPILIQHFEIKTLQTLWSLK